MPARHSAADAGWIIAAVVIAAAMAGLHLEGNAVVDGLWRGMTMEAYQQAALWIAILGGGLWAVLGLILAPNKRWRLRWLVLMLTALLAHSVLVVNHVEAIHFVQYAFLAVLLNAGLRRPWWSAAVVTLMGVGDEVWQYAVLYADHPARGTAIYLDGNDMVLDAIGAAMGAMLSAMHRTRQSGSGGGCSPTDCAG